MNDLLIVMNPRKVDVCMAAFDELPVTRLHLIGMTERVIADRAFPRALDLAEADGVDWVWVVSDDAIVRPHALEAVRELAAEHPVVTGYSQRTHTDLRVNLTRSPLKAPRPEGWVYDFHELRDIMGSVDPVIRTWFTGMSLTGMSAGMWREYPFDAYGTPGHASDFNLSWRLQEANVPIVAHRDAFCYHWRVQGDSTDHPDDASPEHGMEVIEIRRRRNLLHMEFLVDSPVAA